MKTQKHQNTNTLQSLILICFLFFSFSCSNNTKPVENLNYIDYEEFNRSLKIYASSFKETLVSEESIKLSFNKYFKKKTANLNSSYKTVYFTTNKIAENPEETPIDETPVTEEPTEEEIQVDTPDIFSEDMTTFLLGYYNELANAYDYEIPEVLNTYQNKVDNDVFLTTEEKQQFQVILNAAIYAIEVLESQYNTANSKTVSSSKTNGGGFWDCMRRNVGKGIGRGMVGGAITGGIFGAWAGGTGGSVLFPGVGTAAGAVGGGVYGAARGSIAGASLGALWTAADCLKEIEKAEAEEEYQIVIEDFLMDESGEEQSLIIDTTFLNIETDNTINLTLNTQNDEDEI